MMRKLSYSILFLVLLAICFCILLDVNWVFANLGDDFQFLKTTAIGRAARSWSGRGRFWPLGLVDYSILVLIPYGHTVLAHFIYTSIMMIASVFMLFYFFLRITNKQYFISTFFILALFATSSFMLIHMTCIYPERMMFFLLAAFMLCFWKAEQNQSTKYYLLAFLCAAYVTYTKEPVFGAIGIIALTGILFGYKRYTQKDKIFHYALLCNSAIYLIIYIYRWFFRDTRKYNLYNNTKSLFSLSSSLIDNASIQTNSEPLLYVLWIICAIRVYFVLIQKDRKHLFFDKLLFAGMGYAVALIVINTVHNVNYSFPSIILALPSLVYWTFHFQKNNRKVMTIFILATTIFLLKDTFVTSYHKTAYILNCRKTEMPVAQTIAKAFQDGKEIIWLTSYPLNVYDGYITGNHPHYDKNVEWEFEIYTYFLNYCLNINPRKETSILKARNNLENITKNAIILCPERDSKNELIKSKGFRLINKIYFTNIYLCD